jgi:hypothetical protein
MQFTAHHVETSVDSMMANALFADPETNPDQPAVLMLSRPVEFKDSAYYFEINDQSNSSYGGLESVRLTRSSLALTLHPKAVEKFGDPDLATVQVALNLDDAKYKAVVDALNAIFAGHDVLTIA